MKMTNEPSRPLDLFGSKSNPTTSEEILSEDYRESLTMQPKHSSDFGPSSVSKVRNSKKYQEDEGYKYGSHSLKSHTITAEHLFPPPRAEAREHHSTPPQQMMLDYESSSHKSRSRIFPKATTEDPFRVTHPYVDKYQTNLEEDRWKTDSSKAKSEDKKVEVGSTFFFQDPVTPPTTKKPQLQVPPTTESPITTSSPNKKDFSKHTLAHQHLSKIMNDFFAMSSASNPGRAHWDTNKEEDIVMPEYRIPDEDIYSGSESVTDDVEEIPSELLEVVDLITGNVGNEKSNLKPRSSHEIIKINGPITDSHLKQIFLDKLDEEPSDKSGAAETFKKIVVIPQPTENEDYSDDEEIEEITSLKLEQFLKQLSNENSRTLVPLKAEPKMIRQPTVLTAKKIPVRVIYRDQLNEALRPKPSTQKPNIKVMQSHLTSPRMKVIPNEKRQTNRPVTHSFSSYSQPQIILHPSTLFAPHPPPLPRKQYTSSIGYPYVSNSMRQLRNARKIHSRRKRSIINRIRRQIRQNQHFLPFSGPVYPSFNPKFVPTYSPFKTMFNPATASSHLAPFAFPGFPVPKPSQNRPQSFRSPHSRPPPVRHVSPTGHQTVIVEEVPVPIPVEVPNANLIHPISSGPPSSKVPPRYPGNEFRNHSPPAIQTPPLIQRHQNRFPPPPNSYRPFGMPSNVRPLPPVDYRSPIPLTGPLPPRITSQGQVFALGVTNKPILPPLDSGQPGSPNGILKPPPRGPPLPYNPFNVHANSYPNFPYFQGAFTTPISNEPVTGRIMYSGYKPPKSTVGTKPPKYPTKNKDRKTSESNSNRSRAKPNQEYFEMPNKPMRDSHISYTEEVISKGRGREKPRFDGHLRDQGDPNLYRQNFNKNPSNSNEVPRKRKPARRRRPRPYPTTTQGSSVLSDISPTPPPPEQIPPPPADYTSRPSQHEVYSSLPSFSDGSKVHETSSHFPPAGYYGKDQLVQFFDTSSKPHQKSTSPKPNYDRKLGESRSNIEPDDSIENISIEDGNEPVFGTRLRSKSPETPRKRQSKHKQPPRLQTQKNEVRVFKANNRPVETSDQKHKDVTVPNEGRKPQTQLRNERPLPRRRRPPVPRPHNRPPQMPRPPPQVHHYNYNDNLGGFYSVPKGLQTLVAPSERPPQGYRGNTDMFGLPHPMIDQSIYSLRPQGAPVDFDPNFFSVPPHVVQQQQSPLHKMNIKPVPESAREFFTAPETDHSAAGKNNESDTKESESRPSPSKSKGENDEQRNTPVRKLRKPKRKNRYNPHSNEQKDSTEANNIKPQTEQITSREGSTARYKERTTTIPTTTAEPRSTVTSNYHSQNDIKESAAVFKQRSPLLPKTLPELSKSLLNGKIDIQKLNATISTSVSVSGAIPQTNNTSAEEKENKRVFSSQNGGLAVVKKGPKRKRARQRVSSTTGVPYTNDEPNSDAKYEIAASVLDIIKATTETERKASGQYDSFRSERSSRTPNPNPNPWIESSVNKHHT